MDQPDQWFALTVTEYAAPGAPTTDQLAFLTQARGLLARLLPPRARALASYAVALADGLHLVVPLEGVPHASLQLLVTPDDIQGGWMDKHYVWDIEGTYRQTGTDAAARAAALAWLEHQVRRPVERRVLCLFGVPVRTEWEHTDDEEHGWHEDQFPGRVLAFLPGKRLASRTAAGFMDPYP